MPEFVTRGEYNKHIQDAEDGFTRLGRLEAEVLGDSQTSRPSLRADVTRQIQGVHDAMEDFRKTITGTIWKAVLAICTSLIVAVIVNVIINHPKT